MANLVQLRMLEELNGFLLVDKPAGIAFASVVKAVKRRFNLVKVGHGGSLDAMASGLFILLLNDANKFVGDVMGADRAYTGTLRFGLRTNTHDIYGAPRASDAAYIAPDAERIAAALKDFKGDVFQTEPSFCSIRKEGTAAYEVADTGAHTQFLAHVYKFEVGVPDAERRSSFALSCTKNVLVRTLVNDLGETLGCGACLESVRRERVGKFTVDKAIPFDKLLTTEMKDFASCVMPLGQALL